MEYLNVSFSLAAVKSEKSMEFFGNLYPFLIRGTAVFHASLKES